MQTPAFKSSIPLLAVLISAAPSYAEDNLSRVETVRARFQTGLHDDDAPAVYGKPVRLGLLEGNERFRLQDNDNRFALSGDLSAYLQTNDNSYQLVPNELYADLAPHRRLAFNAGRRKVLYGSGFSVNPMDWLNTAKDPLNPQEQRVGAYLGLAEVHTATVALTAIYAPDVDANQHALPTHVEWEDNVALLRGYALLWEGDLNLQAAWDHDTPRAGASYSRFFFDFYEGHFEVASRRGSNLQLVNPQFATLVSRMFGGGVTAPPTIQAGFQIPQPFDTPYADSNHWFTTVLVGTRYTFDSGDLLSLEYMWNGEGLTRGQWDERIALLHQLPASAGASFSASANDPSKKFNLRNLRRNYLFGNAARSKLGTSGVMEDLSANLGIAVNVDSRPSALVYPSMAFRRGDHAKLSAGVAVPLGSPESEYGSLPFREMYVFEMSVFF